MDTISVVIPVFNSAQYLRECVDSVLGQSWTDLDVMLVDDGSSDDSPDICREYVARDVRVRFLRPEPKSVGAARNFGISQARGKYLMFVDSDDVCEPSLAERLMAALDEDGTDGLGCDVRSVLPLCGVRVTDASGKETGLFREEIAVGLMPAREYVWNVLARWQSNPLCGGVYCKLFSVDVLRENGILFEETTSYAEDFLFNLSYLSHVDAVNVLPDALYRYRIGRSGSLTEQNMQKTDPEKIWNRRRQVIQAYEDVFAHFGLEKECARDICAFYLKNVTDVVEIAVRQDARGADFAAWMEPLREDMKRKLPELADGSGLSVQSALAGVPGKYRVTLRLLRQGRYGMLREYEKARRQVRKIRGRER